MKLNRLLFYVTLLCSSVIFAQNDLPIKVTEAQIKPLSKLLDSSLQANLEREIASHSDWSRLISQKKMAVGIVQLGDCMYHGRFGL